MASPEALEKYGAERRRRHRRLADLHRHLRHREPDRHRPVQARQEWIKGDKLVLVRNDDYWGEKAQDRRPSSSSRSPTARPAARPWRPATSTATTWSTRPTSTPLKEAGYQLLNRPAFNVGYVGFNQAVKPLDDLRVRQAIAYAINRENVIKTKYPEGSNVATQFQPPEVFGYADDVTKYDYDPEKAKSLLAAAGQSNLTLEFWYPSGVSRPYMPDPAANFQLMKADLEAVGITVVPKTAPWNPDYLDAVDGGTAAIYLLGWTGDFGDPDNFIGTFFQAPLKQWGFDNPELFAALDAAEAEPDQAKRETEYQDINRQIMDFLPGLPYAHTEPTLAFEDNVEGFVPSPVDQRGLLDGRPSADRPVRLTSTPMIRFIARRLVLLVPILLGLSLLLFIWLRALPGGPAEALLGERATPESVAADREAVRARPPAAAAVPVASCSGRSCSTSARRSRTNEPVADELKRRFPATIELAIGAMIFAIGLGIPLGYYAARRHGTWVDTTSVVGSLLGIAIPVFFLAFLLKYVFAVQLGWLPTSGRQDPRHRHRVPDRLLRARRDPHRQPAGRLGRDPAPDPARPSRWARIPLAIIVRITRASRARGGQRGLRAHRARPRACSSARSTGGTCCATRCSRSTTIIGLQSGCLLSGAVLTETVFAFTGVGGFLYEAIIVRDYSVIDGFILSSRSSSSIVNLLVDVSYGFIDPRVRVQ